MIARFTCLVALCLLSQAIANLCSADDSIEVSEQVSAAVEKAIPYLSEEGEEWIQKRGCVSCHQIPAMLWSLSAAGRAGFDIDVDQLGARQQWATEVVNFVKPERKSDLNEAETLAANIDTMNGLLLAIPPASDPTENKDWRLKFTGALSDNQQPDGSWRACGQLPAQKRPKAETTQVTVLWTLLAMARHGIDRHDQSAALKMAENPAPESTEWWVARYLLAEQMDQDDSDLHRHQLIKLQNADGGWGWLTSEPSDALATGMALYALRKTSKGEAADHAALSAADEFLARTQQSDGSWSVPGTKQSSRNRSTPTSNYWGTAWAVIGLLE